MQRCFWSKENKLLKVCWKERLWRRLGCEFQYVTNFHFFLFFFLHEEGLSKQVENLRCEILDINSGIEKNLKIHYKFQKNFFFFFFIKKLTT